MIQNMQDGFQELDFERLGLMREKSVILEKDEWGNEGKAAETIKSNRIAFKLGKDRIVIRGQHMHLVLRFAEYVISDFKRKGPVNGRETKPDWATIMREECFSKYDRAYTVQSWISLYINGEIVFSDAQSPYMHVIEKCAAVQKQSDYDETLQMTERLFAESGKHIQINHESSLSVSLTDHEGYFHVGLTHRNPVKDTIFSFDLHYTGKTPIEDALKLSAHFIESINLSYLIDFVKKEHKKPDHHVPKELDKKAEEARARRIEIEKDVDRLEGKYKMRYRPERPVFEKDKDFVF